MVSNIFLYSERYAQVREIWDSEVNGDIDVVEPRKHDKIEYSWVCSVCGKKFKTRPMSIASKIDKGEVWCKDCGKGFLKADEGESFEDFFPELAKLWDYSNNGFLTPSMVKPGSNKTVSWVCPDCGISYERSPNRQKETKGYCDKCYSFHREFKYGSLGELHPDKAIDWSDKNELSANEVSSCETKKKRYWKCHKCENEWEASIVDIVDNVSKCSVCNMKSYKEGYTDFKTVYPKESSSWDYENNSVSPSDLYYNDRGSYFFICPVCGKSHKKGLDRVKVSGATCFNCNWYASSLNKRGSLLDVRKDLAMQLDEEKSGVLAKDLLPNDTRQLWWKCDKGHSFRRSPHERVKSVGVCPVCDGKEVLEGFNDFESNYPDLVKYWRYDLNNCNPSEVASKSSKEVWWECPYCDEIYMLSVSLRTSCIGCPNCSIMGYVSQKEKEVLREIQSWGIYTEENARIFKDSRQSVDILIPDKNIAIEFNGVFWHNEDNLPSNYHYDKYMKCKEMGIRLLFVWEDDYKYNRNAVFKSLKEEIGVLDKDFISENNYDIGVIDYKLSKDFLGEMFCGGACECNYYIGIFSSGSLVGVAIFESDNYLDFTLKMYHTNSIIQNGFSNVIDYFRKITWCHSIKVISENGIFNESILIENGFIVDDFIGFDFKYIKKGKRCSKHSCDSVENLKKVWDAGKTVYLKRWFKDE